MGQGGDIIAPRGNPIHSHNAALCGITRRPTCRDLSRSISPNVRSVSSGRTRRALMFFFTKQQWLATANRRSTWSSNLSRKWPRTAGFVRRVCGRSNPKRRTKCCTFFRSFEADQILRIGRSAIVGSRLTRQQSGLPLPAARERLPRRQGDPRAQCGMRTRTALVMAPFLVGTFSNVRCHSVSARGLLPMEIRPNVGTALAACRANETWLESGRQSLRAA